LYDFPAISIFIFVLCLFYFYFVLILFSILFSSTRHSPANAEKLTVTIWVGAVSPEVYAKQVFPQSSIAFSRCMALLP
jgi:hypothetical protein